MDLSQISLKAITYIEPDEFLTSDEIENQLGDLYRKLKLPFGRVEMQTGHSGIYQILDNKTPISYSFARDKGRFYEINTNGFSNGDSVRFW